MKLEFHGRVIKKGKAKGKALVSKEAITFLGGVDPKTGIIVEKGHSLEGKSVKDKILVFPHGKGSTVGSYVLYEMKKNNTAPKAIINEECEPIIAVGAIIAEIPCVDRIPIEKIETDDLIIVNNEKVTVIKKV
ncbi:MAG TPA: DUF126 domain-containing protein [Candidatus Altiarchaeales archaeon]|nr:DUF126 domain-containing protein [Candidatus Altiarchaeales archaeon]